MKRALLGLGFLALSACNLQNLGKNDPDGGLCPAVTAPAGSGSTNVFTVGASYQTTSQWIVDGGVSGALLTVDLFENGILCSGRDGGTSTGRFAYFFVDYPGVDRASTGTFSRNADGGATFTGLAQLDGGLWGAASGTVTITSIQNCSLTGSLDWQLSQGADGGATVPFSATFSSVYCGGN